MDAFVDYLAARPAYVRLLQRAALDDDGYLTGAPGTVAAVRASLIAVGGLARASGIRPFDPHQLVISVIALCFFPFAHQATLLGPLGLDAWDPQFLADRRAHITDLLLHGLTTSPKRLSMARRLITCPKAGQAAADCPLSGRPHRLRGPLWRRACRSPAAGGQLVSSGAAGGADAGLHWSDGPG